MTKGWVDLNGKRFARSVDGGRPVPPEKSAVRLPPEFAERAGVPPRVRVLQMGFADCLVAGCPWAGNEAAYCENGVLAVVCPEHGFGFHATSPVEG
jgi:hypothetical protein